MVDRKPNSLSGRAASIDGLLTEAFPASSEVLLESAALTTEDEGWFDAVTALLVDAVLTADLVAIGVVVERLAWLPRLDGEISDMAFGRLTALADVAQWAQDRQMTEPVAAGIAPGSRAASVLLLIAEHPGVTNHDIGEHLAIDKSEVSRQCGRLRRDGLAVPRRVGKNMLWQLTSRGAGIVDWLREAATPAPSAAEAVEDVRDVSGAIDDEVKEAVGRSSTLMLREVFEQLAMASASGWRSPYVDAALGSRVQMILAPEDADRPWCVAATIAGIETGTEPDLKSFYVDSVAVGEFKPHSFDTHVLLSSFGTGKSFHAATFFDRLIGHDDDIIAVKQFESKWKVIKAGRRRAVSIHGTRHEAETAGRGLAMKEGATMVLIEDHG